MNKEDVNPTDHKADVQLIFITQGKEGSRSTHEGTLTREYHSPALTVSVVAISDEVTSANEASSCYGATLLITAKLLSLIPPDLATQLNSTQCFRHDCTL
jgi:hypothetical protein